MQFIVILLVAILFVVAALLISIVVNNPKGDGRSESTKHDKAEETTSAVSVMPKAKTQFNIDIPIDMEENNKLQIGTGQEMQHGQVETMRFDMGNKKRLLAESKLSPDSQEDKHHAVKPASKIIINSKTEYKPEIIDKPLQFPEKTPNPQNNERRYLIFTKEAYEKLLDSIGWGRTGWGERTGKNRVEQGGILLGRVCQFKNEIYNIVEYVLLADTKGGPAFVEFTPEMWADMQEGLSDINEKLNSKKQVFITGWFHTHPNMSVFMSGTDMKTQHLNFWQEWQASLVLNPQGKESRAFFGLNALDGKVVKVNGI